MSDLVVIGFEDEHTAFEMRAALAKLQKDGAIGEKFNHRGFIFIFLRVFRALCGV